jgi:hypothetical protein
MTKLRRRGRAKARVRSKTRRESKAERRARLVRRVNKVAPEIEKVATKIKGELDDKVIFSRWKEGASIKDLVPEFRKTRSQLRKILTAAAGGKARFKELRAQGAGGKTVPFGGKRAEGGARPAPSLDDSKVPVIHSAPLAQAERCETCDLPLPLLDRPKACSYCGAPAPKAPSLKGLWTKRLIWDGNQQRSVSRAPDGREYIEARPQEKADLIFISKKHAGIGPLRLRLFETSAAKRHLKKEEKVLERGEAALDRKRARKRAAKKARLTRRNPQGGGKS